MDRLAQWVESGCNLMAYAGGTILLVAAFIVAADVTGRNLFQRSIGDASELSGYALAIGSSWAFGFTLLRRGHVRIDVVYRTLPGFWRIAVDLAALWALIGLLSVLVWQASDLFLHALRFWTRSNTPLGTPMVLPIGLWLIGLVQFLFVAGFLAFRLVWLLAAGRTAEARAIAAPGAVELELEELDLERPGADHVERAP